MVPQYGPAGAFLPCAGRSISHQTLGFFSRLHKLRRLEERYRRYPMHVSRRESVPHGVLMVQR